MCGIAGVWKRGAYTTPKEIHRMSVAIAHRGPDDAGHVLIDTTGTLPLREIDVDAAGLTGYDLGLANRRLAIIDLSLAAHQPMTRDGCTIVYNGEIYNYLELKIELQKFGFTFTSQSDTEVLLCAYLRWGYDCLHRLNGMFAFALWDSRHKSMFCGRDRLGIKPFYYAIQGDNFLFASEIKAILAIQKSRPDLNEDLIYDYLVMGWLDHTNETFFRGINKLPPGSFLVADGNSIEIKPYWLLTRSSEVSADFEASVEKFRELFTNSISLQMRSDVDVGCCLSGGMDSSAIVCTAAPLTAYPMKTFTIRYHDSSMDEWKYAQYVARKIHSHTSAVFAEPKEFWHCLPDVVGVQEEPFTNPSVYAQWLLMRIIRENDVSVVLDGQGADEILCGYAKFFFYYLFDMWRDRNIFPLLTTLFCALLNGGKHLLDIGAAKRYLPSNIIGRNHNVLRLEFWKRQRHRVVSRPGGDLFYQQKLDVEKYSLPVLLRYEDKNSMSHSVESRVPFLDHRIVEFALNIPSAHKFTGGRAKRIMRQALSDVLPMEILNRRTKLGFGGNFSSWVEALHQNLESWIDSPKEAIDPYVDRKMLNILLASHDASLFRFVIFDRWLVRFGYS